MHNILIWPGSQPLKKEGSIISSFMSFTNVLDWSRTWSGLHSIIPEHIMTCTRVSQATRAEYRQKYFTTKALCLQIIPVRRPLVSGGEGPEQWYHFKYLSWPHPGSPGKKPQSPGTSVKIWFYTFLAEVVCSQCSVHCYLILWENGGPGTLWENGEPETQNFMTQNKVNSKIP